MTDAATVDLSILVPVYNERDTVERAVQQILDVNYPVESFELVVVDDGSTDGTRELLRSASWPENVRVHFHDRNRGKGAAVRTALDHARGTYSTIMDADLEYDPVNLPKLLQPLRDGEAEAVFGARGFASHTVYSFWYVIGNRGVSFAANLLFNTWISDIMTCHKMMSTALFRSLRLREPGFGIEPEITARLVRAGVRIYEVPITYRARSRGEGKKLTAVDGLRVLRTLLRCRVA
ncbi:MAG TPA: glycosyltransferase family 2 protein [Gaiellaceae bacterium]|nr:glycosyltransferase family 2 protein [Gaiellaceae bacterium]